MLVETERFGSFEMDEEKRIKFPEGIPGFEDMRFFVIIRNEQTYPVYWLQSLESKYVALPVMVVFGVVEDYMVQLRDDDLQTLSVKSQDDLLVMNVVVIPEDVTQMTANLAAPIIVNAREGLGKQVIIDVNELPMRYPIYEAVLATLKGGSADAGVVSEAR
jgi:flagellar assembly factor FliW